MVAGRTRGKAVATACALVSMLGIGTVTAPAVFAADGPVGPDGTRVTGDGTDGTRVTGDGTDGTRVTGTDGTRVT